MKVAVFDTHKFEVPFFKNLNQDYHHELNFLEARLTLESVSLAGDATCVCAFVNDKLDGEVLKKLKNQGVKLLALRSAGHNHVDLKVAHELGFKVVHVPEYSPYAVAEHAVGLILTLNRKLHRAYNRVREDNFSLNGLVGFDLHGKTIGVIGTGKIGKVFAKIMNGFGTKILLYDVKPDETFANSINASYVRLETLFREADIISLHVPLTPETKHMINELTLAEMKDHVMIINTGRGKLIDTKALLQALKKKKIGAAGLDVYEEEEGIFFEDYSETGISDDCLARLLTFPNVFITAHQAFLTREALTNIVKETLSNVSLFEQGKSLNHVL